MLLTGLSKPKDANISGKPLTISIHKKIGVIITSPGLADFIAHPNDVQRMRRYTEQYGYDEAGGNFLFTRHVGNAGQLDPRL